MSKMTEVLQLTRETRRDLNDAIQAAEVRGYVIDFIRVTDNKSGTTVVVSYFASMIKRVERAEKPTVEQASPPPPPLVG